MITLAVDTALAAVQAAVVDGGGLRAALSEPMARGHQERLAPLVAEVLVRAGVAPRDLEKVVVTVGPGSFTGLRVGLAFAKAFALARGLPCAGVGTLEALAASFADGDIAAAIAAPHERVYLQRFTDGACLGAPRLLSLPDAVSAAGRARVVGPGAGLLGGRDADMIGWPDVGTLARLGLAAAMPPDPIYLREVGAQTIAERRAAAGG